MESVKNRKTIRKYKSEDIKPDLLNDLLATASRASTMGNMQLYSVVVTRSDAMKARIAPAHFNQPMVKEAPVVLTFCADFNRTVEWCKYRKAEPGYDNFLSFLNASIDTLLYAQAFCTLAEESGLGICYLGTTIYNPQLLIKELELPPLVMPLTTVTVGYPDENPVQPDRLSLEAFMHEETYHNYVKEDIDRLYAYKELLPENLRFVEENEKETLAQVFTDVRYTKKDNESMSANFLEVLKKQGFVL